MLNNITVTSINGRSKVLEKGDALKGSHSTGFICVIDSRHAKIPVKMKYFGGERKEGYTLNLPMPSNNTIFMCVACLPE